MSDKPINYSEEEILQQNIEGQEEVFKEDREEILDEDRNEVLDEDSEETAPALEKMPIPEILYGIVFTPTKIFSIFRFYQPWLKALVFVVAANILLTLLYFLGTEWEGILTKLPNDVSAYLYPIRANMGIFIGIIFMPVSLLFFIMYVSFMHFISEAAGGKGQVLGLFSAFAFTQILSIINGVLSFFGNMLGTYGNVLAIFLALIFSIWQITVYVIAIRELYILSTLKSILLFFLPIILGVGIVIFMLVTTFAFFMPILGSINPLTL